MRAFRFVGRRLLSTSKAKPATGVEIVDPTIGLTGDQAEFYNLARSFADKELRPFAGKWDEEHVFPVDTFKKCADLGFAGMFVKDDVGGSGLTRVDTVTIVEALATGCVGTTAMLTIHNMCAGMIDKFGNEEQRQKYLPDMCGLNIMASYCLTEPGRATYSIHCVRIYLTSSHRKWFGCKFIKYSRTL
jgi:isobutyryl-CoA dehydrogenase